MLRPYTRIDLEIIKLWNLRHCKYRILRPFCRARAVSMRLIHTVTCWASKAGFWWSPLLICKRAMPSWT